MRLIFLLSAFCFLLFTSPASGQQFKWVTGGGTSENIDRSTTPGAWKIEGTYQMCTDPNGNVYALSEVGNFGVMADTFSVPSGTGTNANVLLTSYTCSGQMRFARLIMASSETGSYGLVADGLGHIYMAGVFFNGGGPIQIFKTGPSISGHEYQYNGIMQFDTLGNFNWIQFVGDNTSATLAGTSVYGSTIALDKDNNIHYFDYMRRGIHLTSTLTSQTGTYDLKYDPSGTLLSIQKLDIDSTWLVESTTIDANSGTMYVTGEKDVNFGTDQFFAAAFDGSRNQVWMYLLDTLGGTATAGLTSVIDDNQGHLYFSGSGATQVTLSATTFKFRNDSVVNILTPSFGCIPIIMKTDTNGNPIWIRNYDGTGVSSFLSLTQTRDKIAAVGLYSGIIVGNSDSINANTGYNPFLAIVDTGGYYVTLQDIPSDGTYDYGNVITSDNKGNLYIGGQVEDSIGAPGIPAYHSVGGNTDFFVMKYGYDCNCVAPASNYSYSGSGPISFSYSGSSTGLDSVVWNFGDGSTGSGTTTTHSYATPGTYTVCATVYTDCGSDTHCGSVTVTVSVPAVASFPGISIYPNPVSNALFITGAPSGTAVKLYDVMGRQVYTGITTGDKLIINTTDLRVGVYALKLTDKMGHILSRNIVKQ